MHNKAATHAPTPLPPPAVIAPLGAAALEVPALSPSALLPPSPPAGDASLPPLLLLLLLLPSTTSPPLGDGVAGCSEGAKSTGAGVTNAVVGTRVLAGSGASELGEGVAAFGVEDDGNQEEGDGGGGGIGSVGGFRRGGRGWDGEKTRLG